MHAAPTTSTHFATWQVAVVVVCGADPGALASKRTRIRAGGLSTAGGRLPS